MLRLPKDDTYISDSIKEYITKELNIMWNDIHKMTYLGYAPLEFKSGRLINSSLKCNQNILDFQILAFIPLDNQLEMLNMEGLETNLVYLNTNNKHKSIYSMITYTDYNNPGQHEITLAHIDYNTNVISFSGSSYYIPAYISGGLTEINRVEVYGIGLKKKFNQIFSILTHLFSRLLQIGKEVC